MTRRDSNASRVSVVLTTLNSARHVARSVQSCLEQTHRDLELIVVDGGSTDATLDIVAGFGDPRIRVIHQPENAGKLPGALNLGMAAARGAYLTWTQDDCEFEPHAIEAMLGFLREHPEVALVYADYWDVGENGQTLRYQRVNPPEDLREMRDDVVRQCFLFRREVYEAVGPQDTSHFPVHEVPWRLRVAERFQLAPLHEPLMRYMVHEGSLTGRIGAWELQRHVARVLRAAGRLDRRQVRRRLGQIAIDQAYEAYVLRGDVSALWRHATAGLLHWPGGIANRGLLRLLATSILPGWRQRQAAASAQWRAADAAEQRRVTELARGAGSHETAPRAVDARPMTEDAVRGSISVVIPAYNQGRYVAAAIGSALAQVPPAHEVIVVDDGSTDETPSVLAAFGDRIRIIRQENQGLAAARNAGIVAASGTHVALLDADDEWTPAFAPAMRALIAQVPGACAYYGAAALIDADGRELPQQAGPHVVAPDQMLDQILRANFLIPSTMVLDRAAVLAVGGFRRGFSGVEDKDLWLRLLLRGGRIVGTRNIVARYRIHDASLSADMDAMRRGAHDVIADLFGPEDADPPEWGPLNRRAWGGFHRYCAITSVARAGDWESAAAPLARALVIDPSLAADRSMFHELALGPQPVGWRGTPARLDVRGSARRLDALLQAVFQGDTAGRLEGIRAMVYRTAQSAVGDVAWQAGDRRLSRSRHWRAMRCDPRALGEIRWWRRLLRTFAPPGWSMRRAAQGASR